MPSKRGDNVRAFALRVLHSGSLADKLLRPPLDLDDDFPGEALRVEMPVRDPEFRVAHARAVKVPRVAGMQDVSQRRRILHALANHELQAVELFAWALLAFPAAPKAFRRGLLLILQEEQLHCELYIERIERLGGAFGDQPVTGHFWNQIREIQSPLEFLCTMGLTFENANLDFAQEYAAAARQVGDEETAKVLDRVHEDEIRHVAFAWRWLTHLKEPKADPWQTYLANVQPPLGPNRARGKTFDRVARQDAGLSESFIRKLEQAPALRPNGQKR